MSRFLLLNFEEFGLNQDITKTIQSKTLFCICCLEYNSSLFNLNSCSHSSYLDQFLKPEIKLCNQVVCVRCHSILIKIQKFHKQVETSFRLLAEESFNITNKDNTTKPDDTHKSTLQVNKIVDVLLQPKYADSELDDILSELMVQNKRDRNIRQKNTQIAVNILTSVQKSLNLFDTETDELLDPQILNSDQNLLHVTSNVFNKDSSKKKHEQGRSEYEVTTSSNLSNSIAIEKINEEDQEIETPISSNLSNSIAIEKINEEDQEIETPISSDLIKEEVKEEMIDIEINPIATTSTAKEDQGEKSESSKIKTVMLTKEELTMERLQQVQSHAYLSHPYKCESCIVGFNYEENLQDHIWRKHEPKVIPSVKCEICLQRIHPVEDAPAHEFRHFARYECTLCGNRYSRFDDAWQHYKIHNAQKDNMKYDCRYCDYATDIYEDFRKHTFKHFKYPCKICGVVVSTSAYLKKHMITVHDKTEYNCKKCKKTFYGKDAYRNHIKIHAYCAHCDIRFKTWTAYCAHLRLSNDHAGSKKRFSCKDCGKKFRTLTILNIHTKGFHAKAQVMKCKHCSKVFKYETELKTHMIIHMDNVLICDHCSRAYKSRLHMIKHLETHEKKPKKIKQKPNK